MTLRLISIFVITILCGTAVGQETTLSDALETGGPHDLERVLADGLAESEQRLAEGALAAMLNRDVMAETLLSAAMTDEVLEPGLRRHAALMLAGVRLRTEDFAGAAEAFDVADAIEALGVAERQARAFVEPLRGVPGIEREAFAPGELAVIRDRAGLPRTEISINGLAQDVVLDTGAAYSTIAKSAAERLGLRVIDAQVSVGASALEDVPAELALAETLELDGARFRNVIFIVLPDDALTFWGGRYTIEVILGLPVLFRLERFSLETNETEEMLRFGPSEGESDLSNLYMEGLSAVVLIETPAVEMPLHLLFDSGAQITNLSTSVVTDHPVLADMAEAQTSRVGGAGGYVTDEEALRLPALTLRIGQTTVELLDIPVVSTGAAGRRHGLLGHDVLSSGRGFVVDFKTMSLEILPAD